MSRVSRAKAYGSRTAGRIRNGSRKVRARVKDSVSRMKKKSPRSSMAGMVNSILQAPQTRGILEELYRRSQGGRTPAGMAAMVPAAAAAFGAAQNYSQMQTPAGFEPEHQGLSGGLAPMSADTMASHWRRRLAYEKDLQRRRGAIRPRKAQPRRARRGRKV